MRTQQGEKPVQGFTCIESTRIYVLTHTEENPYQCHICQNTFTQAGSLKIHMLAHTGDKPYKCSNCKKHIHTVCLSEVTLTL